MNRNSIVWHILLILVITPAAINAVVLGLRFYLHQQSHEEISMTVKPPEVPMDRWGELHIAPRLPGASAYGEEVTNEARTLPYSDKDYPEDFTPPGHTTLLFASSLVKDHPALQKVCDKVDGGCDRVIVLVIRYGRVGWKPLRGKTFFHVEAQRNTRNGLIWVQGTGWDESNPRFLEGAVATWLEGHDTFPVLYPDPPSPTACTSDCIHEIYQQNGSPDGQ